MEVVELDLFKIIKNADKSINVLYNGVEMRPARPILKLLAQTLNVEHINKNTRQLGCNIIKEINQHICTA